MSTSWHKAGSLVSWRGNSISEAWKSQLSASWRLLIFGDSSVTRSFGLLTGSLTKVDVVESIPVGDSEDDAPLEVNKVEGPRVRRVVWLENERGDRLGYAVSWWNQEALAASLPDPKRPIGGNMAATRLDLHREIITVHYGPCPELEKHFGMEGHVDPLGASNINFWNRYYLMWRGGKAICMIYEVFSPILSKWMGSPFLSDATLETILKDNQEKEKLEEK